MKPVIGITTFIDRSMPVDFTKVGHNHIRSVYMAGGVPLLIPILKDMKSIDRYIDLVDGFLFTGGEDVAPISYEEVPIKEVSMIDLERDRWEIALCKEAYNRDIPMLGICRGTQVINVACGGTLYQDIHQQCKYAKGHFPQKTGYHNLYHPVYIERESKLFDIFEDEKIYVNSYHHQAVKDLANSFKVTARSEEGIIEGIEALEKSFVVGVQWHPEALTAHYPQFVNLFRALIEAVRQEKIPTCKN